jgi:autotransporter-associated beta strand protein
VFSLQGANGFAQSATLLQAFNTGTFILDNNAAVGAGGFSEPPIPAAQNNDRIRDDAEVQLRDGNFTYRGFATAAASETFGSLNVTGEHNVVTLTPNGAGGTATVTVAGPLSLASRATLQVASTTLGAASKLFVNGALPAADATGILPRIVGSSDFLTYNGATGLTPYTGYAPDFNTPGTNVSVGAASTIASSVTINALKRTASFTTTIGAGQTLGISSGMILQSSGTGTFTGGTLAFGSTRGVSEEIPSAVHHRQQRLDSGQWDRYFVRRPVGIDRGFGRLFTLASKPNHQHSLHRLTYALEFLNLNVSQTGGQGPINGGSLNDSNLTAASPTLSLSGAGVNAIFNRDIIVDNGSTNAAGVVLRYNQVPGISPLSNTTGSQTVNGNVTLNTSVRLQGGGGSGTGATNFNGSISGPGTFHVANGRVNFNGAVSNLGGFNLGDQGFTAKAAFTGTGSGPGGVTISGGNSNTLSYAAGSLPGGPISVWNSSAGTAPQIIPTNTSTINNTIVLGIGPNPGQEGNATVNVGTGITATWAGPVTGFSPLTKTGLGGLVLASMSSTYTGAVAVNAGTLAVNGVLPASSATVASSAILQGIGLLTGNVTVNAGGTIAPGNSIGILSTGKLTLLGSLLDEIDLNNGGSPLADLLNVAGTVTLTSATLNLSLQNLPVNYNTGTYVLLANDGIDAVSGIFSTIGGLPAGWAATIDYAYAGVDSVGRTGDGNDIAVTLTPEPTSLLLFAAFGVALVTRRRVR